MKTIEECKKILKNCEWNATPVKKGNKWGLRGSSKLDVKTEQEAWNVWVNYCKENGKI